MIVCSHAILLFLRGLSSFVGDLFLVMVILVRCGLRQLVVVVAQRKMMCLKIVSFLLVKLCLLHVLPLLILDAVGG